MIQKEVLNLLIILAPESFNTFVFRIIKKGGKNGLFVQANGMDNAFEFDSIQFSENLESSYNDYLANRPTDTYSGPNFNSLDERLQSEFSDFFASLGINEELMSFINVLSLDKDQRLYLKWLKNLNEFFSH
jgi:complement component 1 Q subcomponent-binding protein